ncbi:MAG: hypothetical protein V7606_3089, partial [Burkholderiales bacterium]
ESNDKLGTGSRELSRNPEVSPVDEIE